MGTTASKGSGEVFSAPPERTSKNISEDRKPPDVVKQTLEDKKGSKPGKDAGKESGEEKQSSTKRDKLRKLFGKSIGSRQYVGTTSTLEISQKDIKDPEELMREGRIKRRETSEKILATINSRENANMSTKTQGLIKDTKILLEKQIRRGDDKPDTHT